jgi:hypothetical protein
LTWAELIEKLDMLPQSALNTDVTVQFENEIYKVNGGLFLTLHTDVLDKGHPYILVDACKEEDGGVML